VVVIVPDAELRSALAAQLAASGVTLLTGSEPRDARKVTRPAILVIDEAAMSGAAGEWVEALWHEGRWAKVLVLTVGIPIPDDGRDWLSYADRDSATHALTQLIDGWSETGNR
jgi:hypothetical protein